MNVIMRCGCQNSNAQRICNMAKIHSLDYVRCNKMELISILQYDKILSPDPKFGADVPEAKPRAPTLWVIRFPHPRYPAFDICSIGTPQDDLEPCLIESTD